MHVLKNKLDGYIDEGLLQAHEKDSYVQFLEDMMGVKRDYNIHNPASEMDGTTQTDPDEDNRPLSESDLRQELNSRERLMQQWDGEEGVMTDQWRVYTEARHCLSHGCTPL